MLGGSATSPAASGAAQATSSSRNVARERLSVILAAQRGSDLLAGVDMEALQRYVSNFQHCGFDVVVELPSGDVVFINFVTAFESLK